LRFKGCSREGRQHELHGQITVIAKKNHSKAMLASMEEEYTAATCSMLGFTGFSLTEQDVIELRNQHTHRAATGLHFVKAHSGLLFEALTLGMMTEMVLTKSAKYIAAAVDMPGMVWMVESVLGSQVEKFR